MTTQDRADLIAQLVRHEGMRLKVYKDPAGLLTIGVGRNLETRGVTAAEALYLLGNDVDLCERLLSQRFAWYAALDPIRQRALLDLCFNLGLVGLLEFTKALAAMAKGDYRTAAREFQRSHWYQQVGARGQHIVAMVRDGHDAA